MSSHSSIESAIGLRWRRINFMGNWMPSSLHNRFAVSGRSIRGIRWNSFVIYGLRWSVKIVDVYAPKIEFRCVSSRRFSPALVMKQHRKVLRESSRWIWRRSDSLKVLFIYFVINAFRRSLFFVFFHIAMAFPPALKKLFRPPTNNTVEFSALN